MTLALSLIKDKDLLSLNTPFFLSLPKILMTYFKQGFMNFILLKLLKLNQYIFIGSQENNFDKFLFLA